MAKKKLLISFSGGRTSGYMLWWLWNKWEDRDNWDKVVVFANTGLESSETLLFVHRCSLNWNIPIVWVEARHLDDNGQMFTKKGWGVKHQVVNFFKASKNPFKGIQIQNPKYWKSEWTWTPYEEMVSVLGIPSTNAPFCSDQLKKKAINSYLRSIKWRGFYKAIGIRTDELDRVNEKYKSLRIYYPLAFEHPMSKEEILKWWDEQEFNLNVHQDDGNCNNCWKKDLLRLCRNVRRDPDGWKWWKYITEKYGHIKPRKTELKPPFNFYRGNLSPNAIENLAKLPDEEINKSAKTYKLDGCSESCEAF